MLRRALPDSLDHEAVFAWRVFLLDFVSNDIFGLKERRPGLLLFKYLVSSCFASIIHTYQRETETSNTNRSATMKKTEKKSN